MDEIHKVMAIRRSTYKIKTLRSSDFPSSFPHGNQLLAAQCCGKPSNQYRKSVPGNCAQGDCPISMKQDLSLQIVCIAG